MAYMPWNVTDVLVLSVTYVYRSYHCIAENSIDQACLFGSLALQFPNSLQPITVVTTYAVVL